MVLAAATGGSKRDFPMLGFWVSLGSRILLLFSNILSYPCISGGGRIVLAQTEYLSLAGSFSFAHLPLYLYEKSGVSDQVRKEELIFLVFAVGWASS